jgi:regulator of replication initiation timing
MVQVRSAISSSNSEDYYVQKLEELVSEMEHELAAVKQENSQLRIEIDDLRGQLLQTHAALEESAQANIDPDVEIKKPKERLHTLELNWGVGALLCSGEEDGGTTQEEDQDNVEQGEESSVQRDLKGENSMTSLDQTAIVKDTGKQAQKGQGSHRKLDNEAAATEMEEKERNGQINSSHVHNKVEGFQGEPIARNSPRGKENASGGEALHISLQHRQLEILNNEKERISRALMEQLAINEEISRARNEEKLWLAKELQNYMGTLAVQEEAVAAICMGIKEFEIEMEQKRQAIF